MPQTTHEPGVPSILQGSSQLISAWSDAHKIFTHKNHICCRMYKNLKNMWNGKKIERKCLYIVSLLNLGDFEIIFFVLTEVYMVHWYIHPKTLTRYMVLKYSLTTLGKCSHIVTISRIRGTTPMTMMICI